MSHPEVLSGAEAKIARARKQTDTLRDEFREFYDRETYTVRQTLDLKAKRKKALYVVTEEFRSAWPVIIGEILHDLRSALDNAVYEMTVIEQGHPLDKTEFPVYEDEAKYDAVSKKGVPHPTSGLFKVRGLNQKAQDLIREAQPFEFRKTHSHDQEPVVGLVHDLNIIDKHRTIHLCRRRTTQFRADVVRDIQLPINWNLPTGTLEDGQDLAEWTPLVLDEDPDVKFTIGFEVALADTFPKLDGKPVIESLEALITGIDRLIFHYLRGTLV